MNKLMTTATTAALVLSASISMAANIPVACQSAKTKEAGSLAKCLETAMSKFVTTGDAAAYGDAVTKCTGKFSTKWQGAEQKATDKGGTCKTTGDEAQVLASIQAKVACIATALDTGNKQCLLCGNGVIDAGENCDLGALGVGTCSTATGGTKPYGTLDCSASCQYNTSGCAAGILVGGAAWFLGATDGASCDAVCTANGLVYDSATLTYAGSSGTDANCAAVLNALGIPGGVIATSTGLGIGCFSVPSPPMGLAGGRDTTATTSSAGAPPGAGVFRACACH
jgi:hypothetical protein